MPGTNPEPPAGMVAVPVAALPGRQQNQMQQAGQQIGVVRGLMAGGGATWLRDPSWVATSGRAQAYAATGGDARSRRAHGAR